MSVVIVGFSTTGKSSILKDFKKLNERILTFDSDAVISREYNNSICKLFIENHDEGDPTNRSKIMDKITSEEVAFIEFLQKQHEPYIAALGPNITGRPNWDLYLAKSKPFVVFLKSDPIQVYNGLKRREDEMPEEIKKLPGFGNWNFGVIRHFNSNTKRYDRLADSIAMTNIKQMINEYEKLYSKIAHVTFDSTHLSSWHPQFDQTQRTVLMELLQTKIR